MLDEWIILHISVIKKLHVVKVVVIAIGGIQQVQYDGHVAQNCNVAVL